MTKYEKTYSFKTSQETIDRLKTYASKNKEHPSAMARKIIEGFLDSKGGRK